jgi:ABC-type lipoprotein export system ATPase subunit
MISSNADSPQVLKVDVPAFSYRSAEKSSRSSVALPIFNVATGEIVVLSGRSGSGKSTLLHLLTGVLAFGREEGSIELAGKEIATLSQRERDRLRPYLVGWMPQRVHLISALSVLDNVMLPLTLGEGKGATQERANALLGEADISELANALPSTLSVGQASRVCAARALVANPRLLCVDEPSAALDQASAQVIARMLTSYVRGGGAAVIASHDRVFIEALRGQSPSQWQSFTEIVMIAQ